jgi:hypothetical protein
MAKNNSGRSGGGITSRNNKAVGVRTGAVAKASSPAGVSQIGSAMGNHSSGPGSKTLRGGVVGMYGGPSPISVVLGNQKALDIGGGGPGTGRTVMRSGTQGTQGPVNPGNPNPGAKKPIFPGFR